jgi:nicotinate-nucleotide pyrophosphorylase (carboxylating)
MIQDDLNRLALPELYRTLSQSGLVRRLLELARDEDQLAIGDITTAACLPEGRAGSAEIVARTEGIVSGLSALPEMVSIFAPGTTVRLHAADGQWITGRSTLAELSGPMREILALERIALNLIGRLSGVATKTNQFVTAMGQGCRAKLYDTRKTTPGLRVLEKYAVRCGGGFSHRMGLHDAVLIKDNHIAGVSPRQLPEFLARASQSARARVGAQPSFIEVEADSLEQFEAMLTLEPGVIDIVLLDNMTCDQLRQAAAMRDAKNPGLELEASGGVKLGTVHEIARTGVDRISVGALTHSAVSIDVAMDIDASAERSPA